jgi:tRNA-dihydrouridine synthase
MAGVSEMPFRRIALELGAGLAPTELVSAEGLFRKSTRTLRYLRRDPRLERPFCVQLFGGDPGRMAAAALVARELGAEIIDINMGCPVPKVTRGGAGSALLCDPPRAADLVRAIAEATGLPVTVKIRSGWDAASVNAVELAQASRLDGAAISMITWMEVAVGGASPEEDVVLRAFLSSFEVLPIDTHIAEEAVRLRRTRRLKLPMNLA